MRFDASSVTTRFVSCAVIAAVCGLMLASTGCGKSKAQAANSPPPQTLSEPVRAVENVYMPSPAIPPSQNVAPSEDYLSQRPGESRALPSIASAPSEPAPGNWAPAPAVLPPAEPAPIATAPSASGGGTYHTLAKGETLYAVARKYNVKPKALIAANSFSNPNQVAVGTKVFIPN